MSEIKNSVIVDLRDIQSIEAAKAIESIENCAILILPSDGDPAVLEALAQIPKRGIATTLRLDKGVPVGQLNGSARISEAMLKKDQILVVNGSAKITEPVEDCKLRLVINGSFLYPKSCAVDILVANGSCNCYDYLHYADIDDDLRLTPELLELAEFKTLFNVDGDLRLAPEVTVEQLKEKMPYFLVDGDVRCNKEQLPYIQLRSKVDGSLRVKGADYDD